MKKEIIVGIICAVVGFLAGATYGVQSCFDIAIRSLEEWGLADDIIRQIVLKVG